MKQYNYKEGYDTLFNNTTDGILIIDDGFIRECNPSCLNMLKIASKETIINNSLYIFFPEIQPDGKNSIESIDEKYELTIKNGNHRFEWEYKRKNGERFQIDVLMTVIKSDDTVLFNLVWRDISQLIKYNNKMEYYAYYDYLTKLPNRRLLTKNLEQNTSASIKSKQFGALLFIEIDDFKLINSSLGHIGGDKLLIEISKRIRNVLLNKQMAFRFGDDKFVILLSDLGLKKSSATDTAKQTAEKIIFELNKKFIIFEQIKVIDSSVGLTIIKPGYINTDTIIEQSSFALLESKSANDISFYDNHHLELMKQKEIQQDLKMAIENNQISIAFQAQVDQNKEVKSVEALLRWKHRKYGNLNPEYVIEIARNTGLLHKMGHFMLSQSISMIVNINKFYNQDLKLSVNLCSQQFQANGFVDSIHDLINLYNLSKGFLTLEITEDVVIDNFDKTLIKLNKLRSLGVQIALDDFGKGFSSLNYLKNLPLDELKIDKSFILDLKDDERNEELIKTIIKISKIYNLKVVAEGVETENQFEFLYKEGCDLYQGYLFHKPVAQNKLVEILMANYDK